MSAEKLQPEQTIEANRLIDLTETDSLVSILTDASKLPTPTLLHLRSLHPTLTTVFRNCVDLCDRAMKNVEEKSKSNLNPADQDWLDILVSDF